MKLILTERKDIISEARSLTQSLSNVIRKKIANYLGSIEIDPSVTTYKIDVSKEIEDKVNLYKQKRKKFKFPLKTIQVNLVNRLGFNQLTGRYDRKNELMVLDIPSFINYNAAEYKSYKTLKKKKARSEAEEAKFNGLKDKIEPSGKKIGIVYDTINEEALTRRLSQVDYVSSAISHEVTHGIQDMPKLERLFNKENVLYMPAAIYGDTEPVERYNTRGSTIARFSYISRPMEIDARIVQYRKEFNKFKKEGADTAGSKLYELIKKTETSSAKGLMNSMAATPEKKLANEELFNKPLAQFYYQMSKSASDMFSSDPRFMEDLNKYTAKVEEINNAIRVSFPPNSANIESRLELMKWDAK